jgi:hypothetical protein
MEPVAGNGSEQAKLKIGRGHQCFAWRGPGRDADSETGRAGTGLHFSLKVCCSSL